MNDKNYKITEVKAMNWSTVAVIAFTFALGTYYYVDNKVSNISTKYRQEAIAQLMTENSTLQQVECDNPIESEINDLRTRGVKTEGIEPSNIVSAATNKRCADARLKIEQNNEKSRNAKLIPVPTSYIQKNFF
jgi:hypothetical protein